MRERQQVGTRVVRLVAPLVGTLCVVQPARAAPTWTQTELTASDGTGGDLFGTSVGISGNAAIVGADGKTVGSNNGQGAAYAYTFNGTSWVQQAELTADDGTAGDLFGYSVAISGNLAIAGAFEKRVGSNAYQGAAYVYGMNGPNWAQLARLTGSDGAANDYFGLSVAISGNTAIVGTHGKSVGSNVGQGVAYIFAFNGAIWAQQAELTASDGAADDLFSDSVAISGNTALVGAPSKTVGSNQYQGAAYLYAFNGTSWVQQAKITASDGASNDNFGYSVAISGATAVVGAGWKSVGANNSQGAAYVYAFNGTSWIQQRKLTASDGTSNNYFGISVAISNNTIASASQWSTIGSNQSQGAAYVYAFNGTSWVQQAKLWASDGSLLDYFGRSLSLSNNRVMVGADRVGNIPATPGVAYVFSPTASVPAFPRSAVVLLGALLTLAAAKFARVARRGVRAHVFATK